MGLMNRQPGKQSKLSKYFDMLEVLQATDDNKAASSLSRYDDGSGKLNLKPETIENTALRLAGLDEDGWNINTTQNNTIFGSKKLSSKMSGLLLVYRTSKGFISCSKVYYDD